MGRKGRRVYRGFRAFKDLRERQGLQGRPDKRAQQVRQAREFDCYTLYGRFRLDSVSRQQVGHRILLIQWVRDHKVLLSAGNTE